MIGSRVRRVLNNSRVRKVLKNNRFASKMVTNRLKAYIELDEIVGREFQGEYTTPITGSVRYNVRMLDAYCKRHGKRPESLTHEELNQFVIRNH